MTCTLFIFLIAFDQLLKIYVEKNVALNDSVTVIPNVLSFTNVHNYGAAWGSFSGYRVLLIAITLICLAVLIYVYISLNKDLNKRGKILLSLIAAGSFGNLIDRIFLGYVRDMFEVLFVDFPVFNVADIFVTLGCIAFAILVIFVYKDRDFDFLDPRKKNDISGR